MRGSTLLWWRALFLLLWGVGVSGCQPAAVFAGGRVIVDPGFVVAEPDPDLWELARNRLTQGEPQVAYRSRVVDSGALSMAMRRVPMSADAVPLEVLAEMTFLSRGAVDGVEAELLSTVPILVGGRQAIATYGTWTLRPVTRTAAQVMIRSPDGLIVISLVADGGDFDRLVPELDALLRSFELKSSMPLDPFLLDEIPFEDPEHDPGRFVP